MFDQDIKEQRIRLQTYSLDMSFYFDKFDDSFVAVTK